MNDDLRWLRLGAARKPHLEDVAERASVLADLCRKHGDVEHADQLADIAAKAAIELALLGEGEGSAS